ncbi:hypothetical protein Btru_052492 [Bulinus truncatus]|nr:hypothetical protein Btru_052492 [Bulinus truncatus]
MRSSCVLIICCAINCSEKLDFWFVTLRFYTVAIALDSQAAPSSRQRHICFPWQPCLSPYVDCLLSSNKLSSMAGDDDIFDTKELELERIIGFNGKD